MHPNLSFYTIKTSGWKLNNQSFTQMSLRVMPSRWILKHLDYMKRNISTLGNIKLIFHFFLAVQICESNFNFAEVELGFRMIHIGNQGGH